MDALARQADPHVVGAVPIEIGHVEVVTEIIGVRDIEKNRMGGIVGKVAGSIVAEHLEVHGLAADPREGDEIEVAVVVQVHQLRIVAAIG